MSVTYALLNHPGWPPDYGIIEGVEDPSPEPGGPLSLVEGLSPDGEALMLWTSIREAMFSALADYRAEGLELERGPGMPTMSPGIEGFVLVRIEDEHGAIVSDDVILRDGPSASFGDLARGGPIADLHYPCVQYFDGSVSILAAVYIERPSDEVVL
jgi:hypothetical protein